MSIIQNCSDQFYKQCLNVFISAKNYKIRLRFYKVRSVWHQENGNVQFFRPPCISENTFNSSTQPDDIYLMTYQSLSKTFVRRSLFSSSSGSCHGSDATWQEIGRIRGSVCSCPLTKAMIEIECRGKYRRVQLDVFFTKMFTNLEIICSLDHYWFSTCCLLWIHIFPSWVNEWLRHQPGSTVSSEAGFEARLGLMCNLQIKKQRTPCRQIKKNI